MEEKLEFKVYINGELIAAFVKEDAAISFCENLALSNYDNTIYLDGPNGMVNAWENGYPINEL